MKEKCVFLVSGLVEYEGVTLYSIWEKLDDAIAAAEELKSWCNEEYIKVERAMLDTPLFERFDGTSVTPPNANPPKTMIEWERHRDKWVKIDG